MTTTTYPAKEKVMPENTPELKIINHFEGFIIYQYGPDYKAAVFKPEKGSACEGWYQDGKGDQDVICQFLITQTKTKMSKEDLKKQIFGTSD